MAENTKIEWCDHTFNPWEGCQKVGPGCDNCYAESRNARFAGGAAINWGPGAPRRRTSASNWANPLKWNREAKLQHDAWEGFKAQHTELTDEDLIAKGFIKPRRPRVFCASLADVFDNAVDPQWRADLFALIQKTPYLDWLLLTKRIGNVTPMLAAMAHGNDPDLRLLDMMPLPNVWIGATIVNQAEADRDIPKLLEVPARVRFLSMEPLLGPVDLTHIDVFGGDAEIYPLKGTTDCVDDEGEPATDVPALDWVIVGGESGPGARPMHPEWARSLRDQCAAAGVPFLFKQWGETIPGELQAHPNYSNESAAWRIDPNGSQWHDPVEGMKPPSEWAQIKFIRVGKKAAGRLLDGRTWDGFPAA